MINVDSIKLSYNKDKRLQYHNTSTG